MTPSAFADHALWTNVTKALEVLDATEADASPSEDDHRARIRFVAAHLKSFFEVDSDYFVPSMLTDVTPIWVDVVTQLTNYEAGPSDDLMNAARQRAIETLPIVGAWPEPHARGGAVARANRLFAEFASEAASSLAAVKASADEAKAVAAAQIEALTATTAALKAQLDDAAEMSDAMQARLAASEAALQTAITEHAETFRQSQTKRDEQYKTWLTSQEQSFDTDLQPHLDAVEANEKVAAETLNKIEALHQSVETAAGKAASAILARDYGSYSRREWVAGVIGYFVGAGVLLSAAVYLVDALSNIKPNQRLTWQFVALKLGLTVAAAAAAAVAIQFGSKSLQRASTSKRVELELRAIGPFLAEIEDEEATKKAKIGFVDRTFGHAWEADQTVEDTVNVQALGGLTDAITKLIGAVKGS